MVSISYIMPHTRLKISRKCQLPIPRFLIIKFKWHLSVSQNNEFETQRKSVKRQKMYKLCAYVCFYDLNAMDLVGI